MTPLSDQDWEWVNAWADGELAQPDAEEFARRLKTEPALGEALASVRQVTSALSVLRPEPGRASGGANLNRRPWFQAAGAAAAVVVAVVGLWLLSNSAPTAIEVHRGYAAQDYRLDPQPDVRAAAGSFVEGFPLLGDANLFLVATDVRRNRASAHFAGINGCRLTVLRGAYAQPETSADVQTHQWVAGNQRFQVIATGMDVAKFIATATYLEQSTRNRLQKSTVLALREAVQSATTCRRDLS